MAEQMQGAQNLAWADNAIKLAVDILDGNPPPSKTVLADYPRLTTDIVQGDFSKGAVFEKLESLLADRRYLLEDRFTRADLTLAALTAPMWDPPEHPTRWPSARQCCASR